MLSIILFVLLSVVNVDIVEPEHCMDYNLDQLPGLRVIVENENEIPDSVSYSLNGEPFVQISRLNTDWPTYMQNYQNHGYSESPAPLTNEILWTAAVTGDEHEFPTPVVVDGIVYYPQDTTGDSLYALDAATGEILWKYRTGYTDDAVTVYDGYVYTPSDSLWCLDAQTGERIWAFGAANDRGGTPIVTEDAAFCAAGFSYGTPDSSIVYRLDRITGEVEWSQKLTGATTSCMSLWEDLLIVPTKNNLALLAALDVETGEIIWENYDAADGYHDSSPVIVDNAVYITGLDGTVRAINVNSGQTEWEATSGINNCPTLSYHNGLLYHPQACLDAATGSFIWESEAIPHGSTGIAEGCLYYGKMWPYEGEIFALNCSDGSEIWSYQIGGGINGVVSSPSIVDGVMYIAGTDWNLYAFGTGLKYTYLNESLNSQVGWNELVATSYYNGSLAASDTISYYINATGIEFEPSAQLDLFGSPNPFYASTSISFTLSHAGLTSIQVYDLSGRIVSDLSGEILAAGNHSIEWNGCYQSGEAVSSGLYICRIESGGVIETTGLCLLK